MTDETSQREQMLLALYDLFRKKGFDAASLADISAATGLGKSSLYHHFPGGKDDMAAAVAEYALAFMRQRVFAPLADDAPPRRKIARMMATARQMYDGGGAPCLVASLTLSPNLAPAATAATRTLVKEWIDAIAGALDAPPAEARARAAAAVIAIEGALIVARAAGDLRLFERALKAAEDDLLA